jgi:hypothetical protein
MLYGIKLKIYTTPNNYMNMWGKQKSSYMLRKRFGVLKQKLILRPDLGVKRRYSKDCRKIEGLVFHPLNL